MIVHEIKNGGGKECHLFGGRAVCLVRPEDDSAGYIAGWAWKMIIHIAAICGHVIDNLSVTYNDGRYRFIITNGGRYQLGPVEVCCDDDDVNMQEVYAAFMSMEEQAGLLLRDSDLPAETAWIEKAQKQINGFVCYLCDDAPKFKEDRLFDTYVPEWFDACLDPVRKMAEMFVRICMREPY